MKDSSGKSKCFGFIDFDAPEEAALAVEKMNNGEYNGKTIYVGRAQKKYERESELRHKFEAIKLEQVFFTVRYHPFLFAIPICCCYCSSE